jgi:hypothetical protein
MNNPNTIQGEGKPDWEGAFKIMQDAFIKCSKELSALKSQKEQVSGVRWRDVNDFPDESDYYITVVELKGGGEISYKPVYTKFVKSDNFWMPHPDDYKVIKWLDESPNQPLPVEGKEVKTKEEILFSWYSAPKKTTNDSILEAMQEYAEQEVAKVQKKLNDKTIELDRLRKSGVIDVNSQSSADESELYNVLKNIVTYWNNPRGNGYNEATQALLNWEAKNKK